MSELYHLPSVRSDRVTMCGRKILRGSRISLSSFWDGCTCRQCRVALRKIYEARRHGQEGK